MEARAFKEEVARYGLESTILAHSAILPEIRQELHAITLSAARQFGMEALPEISKEL